MCNFIAYSIIPQDFFYKQVDFSLFIHKINRMIIFLPKPKIFSGKDISLGHPAQPELISEINLWNFKNR